MRIARWTLPLAALASAGLLGRLDRARQERRVERLWHRLGPETVTPPERFDPAVVDALPTPARRYLLRALGVGAPLARAITLTMDGWISMAPGGPRLDLTACEHLSAEGFVWRAVVGSGLDRFVGFDRYVDGEGAMAWWLGGVVPLVRASGPDVTRSALGRLATERVWLPSSLLPSDAVRWRPIDARRAGVEVTIAGETVDMVLEVDPDGRLVAVDAQRWYGDVPGAEPGYLPWRTEVLEEREVAGIRLPSRVVGIKGAGTEHEHRFIEMRLTGAEPW